MTIVILNSFIARLLNSIGGHIFCYSAISSAGVVLILPGFYVREYSVLVSLLARQLNIHPILSSSRILGASLQKFCHWFHQAGVCNHICPVIGKSDGHAYFDSGI
jgi:hypothetical protein